MSLGAFVMTYDRPDTLADTLKVLLAQTASPDVILVIDNGASSLTQKTVSDLGYGQIEYCAMSENLGPAGAAAFGLEQLSHRGYEWIYWGDDDDPPKTADTLARLSVLIAESSGKIGAVGAVGTRWDWKSGSARRLPDEMLRGPVEVDMIAGGCQLIVNRSAIQEIGLPNARLFFGFEEPDFCLRMRQAEFRLWVDGSLAHEYREAAGRLNLPHRHSWRPILAADRIWRQYYSTRNYIYTMRSTFGRPDLAQREAGKAVGRCATAWTHGISYGCKFARFQIQGVLDGYGGRMGRTVLPQAKDAPA